MIHAMVTGNVFSNMVVDISLIVTWVQKKASMQDTAWYESWLLGLPSPGLWEMTSMCAL